MLALLALGCSDPPGDRPPPVPAEQPPVGTEGLSIRPPSFDPVVAGDVVITDAADLDRLRPYVVVEGDLVIEATDLRTVDLPYLREVGGEVRIWENDALTRLSLPSLELVGGDLSLYDDPLLPDLGGFVALREVGGSLTLNRLPGLVDLRGLEALVSVGRLYLFHDVGLRTLDGLDGLEEVEGPAQVWEDHALREVRLPSLRRVGAKLDLFDARSLEALDLPVLAELGGLELHHCDVLTDLDGALPALTALPGGLALRYDPALTSLDGLAGLTEVGELLVERADALTALGLDGIEAAEVVEVRFNPVLADPGLSSLREARVLRFDRNPALPDCAIEALAERVGAPIVECTGNLDAGCATLCAP